MQESLYMLIWVFILYSFLGWCLEVVYATVKTGQFVNRGFLNGPYCPIYGCGVVIVSTILSEIRDNLLLLFLGSMFLATVLEFLTGFLLEKIFHSRWWDYTDRPFHIKGYVCLGASLVWGVGGVILMKSVHPFLSHMIEFIPYVLGIVMIVIFLIIFSADIYVTVLTVLKLNNYLKGMDELAHKIHNISDVVGENIFENTTAMREKAGELREDWEEGLEDWKEELEDWREGLEDWKEGFTDWKEEYREKKEEYDAILREYKVLLEQKHRDFYRLLRAFPNLKSQSFNESLEKYKKYNKLYEKRAKRKSGR